MTCSSSSHCQARSHSKNDCQLQLKLKISVSQIKIKVGMASNAAASEDENSVLVLPGGSSKHSEVYDHFIEKPEGYKCKHCLGGGAILKKDNTGSTSNLWKHLRRLHKNKLGGEKDRTQPSILESLQAQGFTQPMFEKALLNFIIMGSEPFSVVENPSFVSLLKYCRPDVKLPCSKTVARKAMKMYDDEQEKLLDHIADAPGKVSLITDCWTSSVGVSYHGIVASWISNDWSFEETLLDLDIINGSHTGLNLAKSLHKVLSKFKILNRISSITTDNAYSCDTMFRELQSMLESDGLEFDELDQRIRCLAHIVNLACQAGLEFIKSNGEGETEDEHLSDGEEDTSSTEITSDSEDEMTSNQEDINPSSALTQSSSTYFKLRNGICKIRRSEEIRKKFKRACLLSNLKPKNLILDVTTRWNSTLHLLKRALEFKDQYDSVVQNEKKLKMFTLQGSDWKKIEDMISFLKPFEDATLLISKARSPSMSLTAAIYVQLYNHLEGYKAENGFNHWILEAAEAACDKLNKYYPQSDGLVYVMGLVLDPRCKFEWYHQVGFTADVIRANKSLALRCWDRYYKPGEDIAEVADDASNLFAIQMKKAKLDKRDDFRRYLSLPVVDPCKVTDVLAWWQENISSFPTLTRLVKDFLCASGAGVPVERVFSYGPNLLRVNRQSLSAESVRKLFCLRAWGTHDSRTHSEQKMKAISFKMCGNG